MTGIEARRTGGKAAGLLLLLCGSSVGAQEPAALAFEAERVVHAGEFGRPWALEVGPDGRLYATYPSQRVIRIVDPAAGPIETVSLASVALDTFPASIGWTEGRLWATDLRSTTVVVFGRRWSVARSLPIVLPGRSGEILSRGVLRLLPGDRFVVATTASAMAMAAANHEFDRIADMVPGPLAPSEPVPFLPVWVTALDGTVLAAPLRLSTRHRLTVLFQVTGEPPEVTSVKFALQPFADYDLFDVDATATHAVVVDRSIRGPGSPPTFTVHWVTMHGDTVRSRAYGYAPVQLRDEWIEDAMRKQAEVAGSLEGLQVDREAFFLPTWLPPVTDVHVGADGSVWLRREDVPGTSRVRWEILGPDGERVGAVDVRRTLSLRAVRGLEAWATEESAHGAQHLWHLRVSAP